jgi:acetoin utilization deacetylase AcuC-like enzyme
MFKQLFVPIIDKIMEVFDPGAIILQCGADSLAADRLGSWALSIRGVAPFYIANLLPNFCRLAARAMNVCLYDC